MIVGRPGSDDPRNAALNGLNILGQQTPGPQAQANPAPVLRAPVQQPIGGDAATSGVANLLLRALLGGQPDFVPSPMRTLPLMARPDEPKYPPLYNFPVPDPDRRPAGRGGY
jgi:hypothetical protein